MEMNSEEAVDITTTIRAEDVVKWRRRGESLLLLPLRRR